MRLVALPESWRDRALVVTAVAEPERWLSPDDLPQFRFEKQRYAWMLSRIAGLELARMRNVPPSLVRSDELSFSHSGRYGAAAIGERAGIDIEVPRVIPRGAAHLFLTEEEIAVADDCAIDNALLHFWCAKEAAWKGHGGAIPTLKRVPLRLVSETERGLQFENVETFAGEIFAALTRPTF
ncbi:MAG TPA: 4'-phosphopantetheinyl transferase superfamily protein [Thermoanaerobaculia bacterium]|nr:4'-phosphopantetheinyl transferase superfamily protein [Thermoanaerobaculia bacterium]